MPWCIICFLLFQRIPKKQNFRWNCKGRKKNIIIQYWILPKKYNILKPLIGQMITIPLDGCYRGETNKFKRRMKKEPMAPGKIRKQNPRHHIQAGFCINLPAWEGDVHLDSLICQMRKTDCLSLREVRIKLIRTDTTLYISQKAEKRWEVRIKRDFVFKSWTSYSYAGIHLIKSRSRLQRDLH